MHPPGQIMEWELWLFLLLVFVAMVLYIKNPSRNIRGGGDSSLPSGDVDRVKELFAKNQPRPRSNPIAPTDKQHVQRHLLNAKRLAEDAKAGHPFKEGEFGHAIGSVGGITEVGEHVLWATLAGMIREQNWSAIIATLGDWMTDLGLVLVA